ncbi:hypothetical protein EmuJ_000023900 [Echinococcus multilocularis]|uniref:Uncharacterized protein n=1 Tax=Echinococcus multilocularis TaxID=6211 RepID=A0A087VWU9_ECHMU|nr:hypothetical protein EmuJ_000023900 [Echinococcus multilocularis]
MRGGRALSRSIEIPSITSFIFEMDGIFAFSLMPVQDGYNFDTIRQDCAAYQAVEFGCHDELTLFFPAFPMHMVKSMNCLPVLYVT